MGKLKFGTLRLQGEVFVALQSFRHLDVPCFSSISSFHDAGIWGYVSGVWGYVGEVFAALESSHQRSHLPFTHSSGALPWLVSVIDTIFTSKDIHPNILLWTFSYICKKERKRKILQLQIQTCSCLENEPNTCFLATFHNRTKNQLNSLWRAIIALPFPIQRAEAEGWGVFNIYNFS